MILGYGVNAYFDIMLSLCYMFISISIFCIPLYYMYAFNDAKGLVHYVPGVKYHITKWSIGNMGGATVFCQNKAIKTNHFRISCPNAETAQIDVDNAVFGVMNQHIENKAYCTNENAEFINALNTPIEIDGETRKMVNCTQYLDQSAISKKLEVCRGSSECELSFEGLYSSSFSYDPNGECGDNANFFIQVPCKLPEEAGANRTMFGLLAGCVAVFIYLFTVVYFDYIKSVQHNKYVDFDVKTITAGDYTIEFDLEHGMYEHF